LCESLPWPNESRAKLLNAGAERDKAMARCLDSKSGSPA